MDNELKGSSVAENSTKGAMPLNGEKSVEISLRRRFFNVRTLMSFALAIGLIILVFERLDIDFNSILATVLSCNPLFYVLAFASYYLTFPLRALRWRMLLNNAGFRRERGVSLPSLWGLTKIMIINWFANSVLYARLGDAYRSYLLKEEADVSFSKTIGTVLAERVIDIIVVFLLLMVTMLGLLGGESMVVAAAVFGAGTIMLALVAILILLVGRFSGVVERHLPTKVKSVYSLFREGTLGSFERLPLLCSLSVVIWLLEAGRLLFISYALGVPIGFSLVLFVALASALLTAIPFTPGGLGLVETGMVGLLTITLSLAGLSRLSLG
ncbi:lysylphosphatidylglycerol synthase transmembrane domain-containing protein [Chloroflexota bacterium]